MNIYNVYERLPVFIQNIFCSIYGWKENRLRFSKEFHDFLKQFIESDNWNRDKIDCYKNKKISESLLIAKNSGLYAELDNVSAESIRSEPMQVLSSLAVLSKDILIERSKCLNRNSFNNQARKVVTSGTTGKALSLFKDRTSFSAQWAIWLRHRNRFGIELNDLSVNFTGKPLVPLTQKKAPYWRFNAAQNQYLISMQHINTGTIEDIVIFLNSIKPKFYSGYPSIIAEISRLSLDKGLILNEGSKPDVIFTGAEKLLSYQAESIEKWCGVQVTDQYGLSEGNCNFSKCEYGYYHEDFEFCHIELENSELLDDGSRKGNLIGTAFYNAETPLLRYDTGDIAIFAPEGFECLCGRKSQVILDVDGRIDDYIVTPDGQHIMRLDYLFKDTFEVIEAQVIQEKVAEIIIKAAPSSSFSESSFQNKIIHHFQEYISRDMTLKFEYVDRIERTSTGKFKAVINRLKSK